MAFCPHCGYEYKKGITRCTDCGAALEDSLPVEKFCNENIKWIQLNTFPGRIYADMLKEMFEKEGIPVIIRGSGLAPIIGKGTKGEIVKVMVPEKFLEKCEQILSETLGNSE